MHGKQKLLFCLLTCLGMMVAGGDVYAQTFDPFKLSDQDKSKASELDALPRAEDVLPGGEGEIVPFFDGNGRSTTIASVLSFIVPGLGQVYAGFYSRGIMLYTLELAELAGAVGFLLASSGPEDTWMNPFYQILSVMFYVAFLGTHYYNVRDAYLLIEMEGKLKRLVVAPRNDEGVAVAWRSRF